MITTQDFYTGEPVSTGSPPFNQGLNAVGSTEENIAANMASFGKYDYDPGSRGVTMTQPASIYPGGYGYNTYPQYYQQQPYYYGQQYGQQIGIGAQPMTPYGNIAPTYNQYRSPYNQYYQQPVQQQPTQYFIPGVNNRGEYLPPANYEEKILDLQRHYWAKQQELEARQAVDRQSQQSYYGAYGSYNYYGAPYYNSYQYNNSLNSEIMASVKSMQDEARENRQNFNFNLSRLAHNIAGDGISDEAIRERYNGKYVDIPQSLLPSPQEYQLQTYLSSLTPYDNSQIYRDHYAAVSAEFNKVITPDMNMQDTFNNMGIVWANWQMEEEMHRRRDSSTLYDSSNNGYKYFVRKKAQERYAAEKGIKLETGLQNFNPDQAKKNFLAQSPVLSQNATLADDGTLNISLNIPYNVGSNIGKVYSTAHNTMEKEYDEKRNRFIRCINSVQTDGDSTLMNKVKQKSEDYSYE